MRSSSPGRGVRPWPGAPQRWPRGRPVRALSRRSLLRPRNAFDSTARVARSFASSASCVPTRRPPRLHRSPEPCAQSHVRRRRQQRRLRRAKQADLQPVLRRLGPLQRVPQPPNVVRQRQDPVVLVAKLPRLGVELDGLVHQPAQGGLVDALLPQSLVQPANLGRPHLRPRHRPAQPGDLPPQRRDAVRARPPPAACAAPPRTATSRTRFAVPEPLHAPHRQPVGPERRRCPGARVLPLLALAAPQFLSAHNARFDRGVLRACSSRCGRPRGAPARPMPRPRMLGPPRTLARQTHGSGVPTVGERARLGPSR